jgi:hypothetical protein
LKLSLPNLKKLTIKNLPNDLDENGVRHIEQLILENFDRYVFVSLSRMKYISCYQIQKQFPNIQFKWTDPNFGRYEGDFNNNNLREGRGVYFRGRKFKYEGEFKNDLRDGRGTAYYYDKEKYFGTWYDNNRIYNREGRIFSGNGTKYDGEWKNNLKEGKGTMYYGDSCSYEGEWKHDYKCGRGVFTWKDNSNINNVVIYNGDFFKGLRDGRGSISYSDSTCHEEKKYFGEWKQDKKHGNGSMIYWNKAEYIGNWADDQRHGKGVYIRHINAKQSEKYDGEWVNGKKCGRGIWYYPDKSKFDGIWKNGKKIKGTLYHPDGRKTTIKKDGSRREHSLKK